MLVDSATALTPTTPTIPTSLVIAIFSAYAMDFLKRLKQLPKINYYSTKLNSLIRLALSGIGTLGVAWSWSAAGTGHQLLITIPAWSAVAIGLYHWGAQFVATQFSEIILAQRQVAKAAITAQADMKPPVIEGK